MNLFDVLIKRDCEIPIFRLLDGSVPLSALLEMRERYSGILVLCYGKAIALCVKDVPSLAVGIILLDGVCASVSLIPYEGDLAATQSILRKSGATLVVSDYLESGDVSLPVVRFETTGGGAPSDRFVTEWLLPTSGTTGEPKLVSHTMEGLSRTVKLDGAKGEGLCWGALYDIRRFAGLQVFLQSLLGGSTLALMSELNIPLAELLTSFGLMGVNALSATPTMWQKVLMTPESDGLELKQVTLGGEIVRQRVLDAVAARFPSAKIRHIYASTELGVGFSVADGLEGFPAEWLDGEESMLRINPDNGELSLRRGSSWFETGDAVEKSGSRVFFCGRLNGSINVGGNKVMPEEIERVLMQYPGVALASVSARSSSIMGNLVHADIMADSDLSVQEFRKGLLAFCRQRLDSYKVPAFIQFVEDLSTSASGKLRRRGGLI